jgi:hypothetical protein
VVTVYEGESSQWLELSGSTTSVPASPVTVLAVADGSIVEEAQVTQAGSMTYRLRAKVKSGLTAGTHHGQIEVRACEDDPLVCARPYAGSPYHVPIDVVMAPAPGCPTTPPNGDFSAGTAGWIPWMDLAAGGRAILSTAGGALRVGIPEGGRSYSAVKVSSTPGISLEEGKRYRLEFDAWAAGDRTLRVSVQENGRDLDGDGSVDGAYLTDELAPIALTGSAQHFQYTWRQPLTNRRATVAFFVGGSDLDVYLDNVTVTELPAEPDWLSFQPNSLNVTVYPDEPQVSLQFTATPSRTPTSPVQIGAVLDGALLDASAITITQSAGVYTVRVKSAAGLSAGGHDGFIEVRACLDSPTVCSQPYGNSPFLIPVHVQLDPDPGYPISPPNGTFSADTAGWKTYLDPNTSAAATLSADGGALHVNVADGGPQYYSVQVSSTPGISLQAGKRYRLDFDAWADAWRFLQVSVQENGRDLDGNGSPYNTYLEDGLAPISMSTSSVHYQYFWTQPVTNRKADVDFFVGGSAADVFIDNVTVTEVPADADWLWFQPSSLAVTVYPGEPQVSLQLTASRNGTPTATVHVGAFVDAAILDAAATTVTQSSGGYTISVRSAAGLSPGGHDGNVEVRACLDSPTVCSQPYGGSPWLIPIHVQVDPDPGYPTSPPNGTFTTDTTGWKTYLDPNTSAAAGLASTGGALQVNLADGGPVYYSVQVSCTPGIDLEQGKHYRLDFDAWADAARTIRVSVQENGRDLDGNGSPYNTYLADGLAPISLTTSLQHFQYTWTQPVTNRKANVDFFVGASAADVYVDNVTVVEVP